MELNPKLLNKLNKIKLNHLDSCLTFLFTLEFKLEECPINPLDLITLQVRKIIHKDIINNRFRLKIPLFLDGVTHEDSSSIQEYLDLFREHKVYGDKKLTTKRILRFLNENPDYTYTDILEFTKYYIRKTERKYIRKPQYFLYKRVQDGEISPISEIIDEFNDKQTNSYDSEELI